jgi:plasmid stabilization system protein ParE
VNAKFPIVLDFRAEEDIDAAAQWYAQQSSELAIKFLEAIDVAFDFIAQFPQASQEIDLGIRRTLTKKFPFFIYYTVDDECVTVFAVLHIRRSPYSWQQRLE